MKTGTTNPRHKYVAGCYVDEARGVYMVDTIVEVAQQHGMSEPEPCTDDVCPRCHDGDKTAGDGSHSEWAHCVNYPEVESECDTYMNEHHAVEGHYWGRSDQGDWGLWEVEEN